MDMMMNLLNNKRYTAGNIFPTTSKGQKGLLDKFFRLYA